MNGLRLMLPDRSQLDGECHACGDPVSVGALLCPGCDEAADTLADLRYERLLDGERD